VQRSRLWAGESLGGIGGARAKNVVRAVAAEMEPPNARATEGFAAVHVVANDEDSKALLAAWGCGGGDADEPGNDYEVDVVSKFPRTRHLMDLGAATRDDLRVPTPAAWLAAPAGTSVVVEEKIDGANMGFRVGTDGGIMAQNRSHFVTPSSHPQFRKLDAFLRRTEGAMRSFVLRDRNLVLYGEWVYATHSVAYDALPDFFVAFDLRCLLTGEFVSRAELELVLRGTGLSATPLLMRRPAGEVRLDRDILPLVHRQSSLASESASEGVYVRLERDGLTQDRAKIVRPGFVAGCERWDRFSVTANGVVATE